MSLNGRKWPQKAGAHDPAQYKNYDARDGEPRRSEAIYDHLEAFWNKTHLAKCVWNLFLHKIQLEKLF